MFTPYVSSAFVPGQKNQQPNKDSQSRVYVPDQQKQSAFSQAYVPGQENDNYTLHQPIYGRPYVPGQKQQPAASHAYVPGKSQNINHCTYSNGHAYIPGQTQPQMQAYVPGQSIPNNSMQQQQQGAHDPYDPNDERGLLSTGGKIALGVGAAAVAYNAYNQFQQSQIQQQQEHLTYVGEHQPVFEQAQRKGVLTIYLDRLTNLANTDFLSKSDPYVKLSIEQDNWIRDIDYGKQFSTRKNDDLNPIYNEVFHFNLPTLQNMVLSVKVMDDDGGVTSDDKLGWCKIKLWELGLNNTPRLVERVIDRNVFSKNGKCYLRLAYSG